MASPLRGKKLTSAAELENLQRESFSYFVHETNPANGLVIDKTAPDWPASIAAIGLALAAYPVGVERGFLARAAAVERTLATLRFFWNSPHGPEPDATGYQGFYYHFLDMRTGRRAWHSELSWHHCALGSRGVVAVCTRNRIAGDRTLHSPTLSESGQSLRLQGDVQSDLSGNIWQRLRLGVALALRIESGADRADDRELPQRLVVALDAKLPIPCATTTSANRRPWP
jgi:hypothetical protein